MSRFVRIALLVALGVVVAASAAFAVVPDPAFSSFGTCLVLTPNGDPAVGFTVSVRDQFNNAVNNSNVTLDFSAVANVGVCHLQDATFGATGMIVYGHTNASGIVVFTPRGGILTGGTGIGTINIAADGQLLGSLNHVASAELDGDDYSVGLGDLGVFSADYGTSSSRSNTTCDGTVGLGDLGIFSTAYGVNNGAFCP
jgi:hypothetical protein